MRKLKLLLVLCLVAIAASAGTKTVYLAPGEWNVDGARFALYHFTGETDGPWVDFTDSDGDGIFSATFDDSWASMIICRMNGSTDVNNWDNKWNQTENLSAPASDNLLYTIVNQWAEKASVSTEAFSSLYTKADLLSDGWTQITTISQSDITDKFYVFVADDKDLMLGLANSTKQSSTVAFYQIIRNPALDAKKVWTLEANGGNYAMRNFYSNSRQMQTEWSGSSNDIRWRTNDQKGSISWTGLGLAYADGAWTLTSTQYTRPLGAYNNDTGAATEGKQLGANDAGKGQKFQIYAISRSAYWALAASLATKANPITSVTGLIKNQEIYNNNKEVIPSGWSEETGVRATGNNNRTAGTGLTKLEAWRGSNPLKAHYYQELTDIPEGVYRLTALAGDESGNGGGNIYISNGISEQNKDFTSTGNPGVDETTGTIVSNGTLTIGMRADGNASWVHAEDFRLEYLGKAISNEAVELPGGGAMAKDKWYYFDLPADSKYNLTLTTIGDIVYTTDGSILLEDESTVTDNFSGTSAIDLDEGRYYIKSSSAQSFSIVADVKTYSVGDVTAQSIANGDYLGSLTTLVLTYGDAATNDGDAALTVIGSATAKLKKNGVDVATGTLTANDGAKTLTATFSDVTLVANATDYSIVIPAGAFGYEGESVNTEATVTFNTGLIADGLYYFQKKGTQKYLGRGGRYGTEAVAADLGISFELYVQTDGTYYLKNHDWSLAAATEKYLGFNTTNNDFFTDRSADKLTLVEAEGGYILKTSNNKFATITNITADIDVPYDRVTPTDTEGDAIIWVPISKATYADNIAAVRDAEAAAIAASAGKSAATLAALKTLLADGDVYKGYDVTSSIKNAACTANLDNWTQVKYAENGNKNFDANGTCGEVWDGLGGIKQEISGLTEGIYKVSVHATWRPGGKGSGQNAGNEINTNAWVYANTATSSNLTQLKSWYAGGATIDSRSDMAASDDTYLNDVYVYVSEGETLTIGLASPTKCNGAWLPFFGWSLTYYKTKETITASFVNGKKWANVYAYAWYDDGDPAVERVAGDWPGTELDTPSGSITYNGEDLDVFTYSYTGFDLPEKIIFNDGTLEGAVEGINKTADLTFVDGMRDESMVEFIPVYAVVGSNKAETDKAFFSGIWDAPTITDILTESAGSYSKTYSNLTLDKQTIAFKVIKKAYLEATSAISVSNWYPAGDNVEFDIPVKGKYDITITFNGNEGSPVVTGEATKVSEAVTISDKRWATTVTNSPLDFSRVTEFDAYTATVSDSKVVLTKVDDVQAETGLVLKLKDGEDPATFYVPLAVSSSTDKGSLKFSSTLTYNTWHDNGGENNKFYGLYVNGEGDAQFTLINCSAENEVTIPAQKAFLLLNNGIAQARLEVVFDDETTGISTLNTEDGAERVYNLNGQRVNAPSKGLYIVNGKKVVKK